jgi:hypothetical protein
VSDEPLASYQFFSWARMGASQTIATVDPLGSASLQSATITVALELQDSASSATVNVSTALYGPAEATGFDARVVARTVPPPGTVGFEPSHMVAIEFSRPDFPWLMTPARASDDGRLRPWICLIVVKKGDGVQLDTSSDRTQLLQISSSDALAKLPDISQTWAWAHVQVIADPGAQVVPMELLATAPDSVRSRLLFPGTLDAFASYYACVVPAFTADGSGGLVPAWTTGSKPPLSLPVYYAWEFTTGDVGDFGTLAALLKVRTLSASVGTRTLSVEDAGFGLPPAGSAPMPGVLRPLESTPASWNAPTDFKTALAGVLDTPSTDAAPLLKPPIYGRWFAGVQSVDGSAPPSWLSDLNLDPRYRAFAGAGARVVEAEQEDLLASAWAQLGDVEQANHLLRIGQLSRGAIASIVNRRLAAMGLDEQLVMTAPLHARVRIDEHNGTDVRTRTLEDVLTRSDIADAVKPAVRRATWSRRRPLLRNLNFTDPIGSFYSVSIMVAFLLRDGRVFLAGAIWLDPTPEAPPASMAWVFDPARSALTAVGSCPSPPLGALAGDGPVVLFGNSVVQAFDGTRFSQLAAPPDASFAPVLGLAKNRVVNAWLELRETGANPLAVVNILDIAANTWTSASTELATGDPWTLLTLVEIDSGVLIISDSTALVLDLDTLEFEDAGAMLSTRSSWDIIEPSFTATKLLDGRVLVTGGETADCEIFEPNNNAWRAAPAMARARTGHRAVLLGDGRVLVVGGTSDETDRSTEIFDPLHSELGWVLGPSTSTGAVAPVAAFKLSSSRILVVNRGTPTFEVISLAHPPAVNAQPVTIADYFNPAGLDRVEADIGAAGPVANGTLLWPNSAVVSAVNATGALRDGSTSQALFQEAAKDHFDVCAKLANVQPPPAWNHGGATEETAALLPALVAERTTYATLAQRIDAIAARPAPALPIAPTDSPPATPDPLEPILDAPSFPQEMYSALRDQSADFILPGVGDVPDNTLALLSTTPEAIEAYLVGLNAAVNQMLLWRGYPTDQRGTSFQAFWDKESPNAPPDIDPVTSWPPESRLGSNVHPSAGLVLLVRGQLLQRYPDTRVYAVQATWSDGKLVPAATELDPVYRATLAPDLTFIGFALSFTDVVGGVDPTGPAGWYFVLQQKPTSPVFTGPPPPISDTGPAAANIAAATLLQPTQVLIHGGAFDPSRSHAP